MGAIAPPCMVLITDIYIAFFLWRGLRATRPPIRGRTDRIISRLITYNSERGILLCIVQLICLAAYIYDLVSNITGTTGSIYFIEGPIYFNSGMAVLNVRRHMRERLANHHLFVETMHLERRSRLEGDNGIAR
ncbi:hypothetical protein DAEQUDRAFT_760425 [Daedalea quercina L-15889]|uniref:DUF6534 domain-containing protein n=1 Tax=Daedalea quercina L-15889 TaxID=1314783 RepID=A0A165KSG4_9APHY|nr:hypothetical protein DAEQUDRAFT_760425 [Daedalea quercina L-15889]